MDVDPADLADDTTVVDVGWDRDLEELYSGAKQLARRRKMKKSR